MLTSSFIHQHAIPAQTSPRHFPRNVVPLSSCKGDETKVEILTCHSANFLTSLHSEICCSIFQPSHSSDKLRPIRIRVEILQQDGPKIGSQLFHLPPNGTKHQAATSVLHQVKGFQVLGFATVVSHASSLKDCHLGVMLERNKA